MSNRLEDSQRILSHNSHPNDLEEVLESIRTRIKQAGDKQYFSVARQLQILDELAAFELGRFMIQNRGWNGYWTHYVLTYPEKGRKIGLGYDGKPLTKIEDFLLNEAPTVLATQERYRHFLAQNQQAVQEGVVLACVPCGLMGELLHLDYSAVRDFRLVGIDIDRDALDDARALAQKLKLDQNVDLLQKDAWNLGLTNEFDLISSNGLNIYEAELDKVTELYHQFYLALKPGGKLVTSFLTYPLSHEKCECDLTKINAEAAQMEQIIFSDILNYKGLCFCTYSQMSEQLTSVGFKNIKFIDDAGRLFPTVLAQK